MLSQLLRESNKFAIGIDYSWISTAGHYQQREDPEAEGESGLEQLPGQECAQGSAVLEL